MTSQQTPPFWEDGIDLRKWMDALVRRWWLVLAIPVVFTVVAGVFGYGFQDSTYESSAGATLPPGSPDHDIGLTERGYQEFASSTSVMDAVSERLQLGLNASQLRNHYGFTVDEDGFITATAHAQTAEQAFLLADAWVETYNQKVQRLLQQQFDEIQSTLLEELDLISRELEPAREDLEDFDLENPLYVVESQSSALESELVQSKLRLRELRKRSIPELEATLASLQDSLRADTGTVGGGGTPKATEGAVASGLGALAPITETASSPAFYELNQELMQIQLSHLEEDLVEDESRLRELTLNSIPVTQTKIASLEKALSTESEAIRGPGRTGASDSTYVQLSQDLTMTRVELEVQQEETRTLTNKIEVLRRQLDELQSELVSYQVLAQDLKDQFEVQQEIRKVERELAARQREIERLESSIPDLEVQLRPLRKELAATKEARQDLQGEVTQLMGKYASSRAELDRLSKIGPDLASLSSLTTIREPAMPERPVSPQRGRNTALAAVLGLFVGVATALLWDFYRAQPSA